jgi:hypothetical protein
MDLKECKQRITEAEQLLARSQLVEVARFTTPHGMLALAITDKFRKRCKKGKVWKTPAMLTAVKNAAYGFDSMVPRSRGGSDGIFCIDREYRPENSMMQKIFNQFLDKPDPLVAGLERELGAPKDRWTPVRLVSHHMRLLGVLIPLGSHSILALIDFDQNKE